MMKYDGMMKGVFLKRPNRFIAHVTIEDELQIVHVKNTGRCKELLSEGAVVYLEPARNPQRKTGYSLISVEKSREDGTGLLVNMDSQVPNAVVEEALLAFKIPEIGAVTELKREAKKGNSRFDFYYETVDAKGFIEVKGVTLEESGVARFPDAPTVRGNKHIQELIQLQKDGFRNYIVFLVQMKDVQLFTPNDDTDPAFGKSLRMAYEQGVGVLCYDSLVEPDSIFLDLPVPVEL